MLTRVTEKTIILFLMEKKRTNFHVSLKIWFFELSKFPTFIKIQIFIVMNLQRKRSIEWNCGHGWRNMSREYLRFRNQEKKSASNSRDNRIVVLYSSLLSYTKLRFVSDPNPVLVDIIISVYENYPRLYLQKCIDSWHRKLQDALKHYL